MAMDDLEFTLEEGESRAGADQPILSLVPSQDGGDPYLWIGNDSPSNMLCFATLQNNADLKKLANRILAELAKSDA